MSAFHEYFKQIRQLGTQGTEHTYRTPFENLLNAIKPNATISITHEPERQQGFGAPDFKIECHGAIIGYIETKKLDEALDKTLKSPQIKKYLSFVPNLIVTNYHEFILIKNGKVLEQNGRETLFYVSDLETTRGSLEEGHITNVQKLFQAFFLSSPIQIGDAKKLAFALAERGKILKEYIAECFSEQATPHLFSAKIQQLYALFKENLVKDLTEDDFADVYAQTVIYGFFLARMQSATNITLHNASHAISSSFQVMSELFSFISHDTLIPKHITWIFQEILQLINHIDMPELAHSLSFRKRSREHTNEPVDPYLYFYETFLGAFDAKKRKAKGVYYTPVSVVGFIIRSIHHILQRDFHKSTGFADPSVTVLDFAAGTGTFLVSIFESLLAQTAEGEHAGLIRDHLLQHFYGFEYLVAPYAVAHLKLSQLLKEYKYELQPEERLQIYLTDTLDNSRSAQVGQGLFIALAAEGNRATDIKDQQSILIITGNPPYNSRSTGQRISGLMSDYKPEKEKNIQPLNDDYIKFIRFAHDKIIEKTQHGIIGIITNNSYLNGLIHRQMRNALLQDFNDIYILNLHGNARIQETCPDGTADQNVFDIMQGVAISLFVRTRPPQSDEKARVWYADVYGKQQAKYDMLNDYDISSIQWEELNIAAFNTAFKNTRWGRERFGEHLSFFVPTGDLHLLAQYGDFWRIHDIFTLFAGRVKFRKDQLLVKPHFTKASVMVMLEDMQRLSDYELLTKYQVTETTDWKLCDKRQYFRPKDAEAIQPVMYRPFDLRYTYYPVDVISKIIVRGDARKEVMQHFFHGQNIGLIFMRQVVLNSPYLHFLVTDKIIDNRIFSSSRGIASIAPLYTYARPSQNPSQLEIAQTQGYAQTSNFTEQFKTFLKRKYPSHFFRPEEILSYIYAICYAPTYRKTYLEFLQIDFPRIPFVKNYAAFQRFSALGQELIDLHLMRTSTPDITVTFPIPGNDTVEKVNFVESPQSPAGRLYINTTQYFDNIPTSVYEFYIGGYQVLDKWLKSRIGRVLSYQDQQKFKEIVGIVKFTMAQMQKIDAVWQEVMP